MIKFILLVLLIKFSIRNVLSDCVMYGECGPTPKENGVYNCKYNGPAKLLSYTVHKKFRDVCPHLYTGNETYTCCNAAQVVRLIEGIAVPRQLMIRCPACFLNFRSLVCDFSCSPNQHEFVHISAERSFNRFLYEQKKKLIELENSQSDYENAEEDEENNNEKEEETKIDNHPEVESEIALVNSNQTDEIEVLGFTAFITEYYAEKVYNACKDVQYSASSQKIPDLLCGSPTDGCSAEAFVKFIGDNHQSPYKIYVNLTNKPIQIDDKVYHPANSTTVFCHEQINWPHFKSLPCSCSDCTAACPVPQAPPVVKLCKVWALDCLDVVFIVLFCVCVTAFFSVLYVAKRFQAKSLKKDTEKQYNKEDELYQESVNLKNNEIKSNEMKFFEPLEAPWYQRVGAQTEEFLNFIFRKLGFFCAAYPCFVLIVGAFVSSVFMGGLYFFDVITDPVELWSPMDSTTRLNKNFYDTHFRPFYRTTQLIVRPTKQEPWTHSIFGYNDVQYSSTLELDFLLEVLELQNKVSSLKASLVKGNSSETVSLSDICFKPLSPDNEKCTIQSIFGYWQNDANTMRKTIEEYDIVTHDYLTHFENCVAAPSNVNDSMQLSCLSDYGGIIMPYVSLGGYPQSLTQKQYGNATALVITYIINNHKDPKRNLKAMAWEKEVINFLKEYSNPKMTLSFSTERSIQDELDRESQSDVKTILISYLAMFLYITLTLGKYRVCTDSNLPNKNEPTKKRNEVYTSTFWRCFKYLFASIEKVLVDMKFTLGIAGVLIVMLSVTASIGLFSYFQIKATLIIFEVIPFLVLAVGVDNIFILVQSYQRDQRLEGETLETQIARIVGHVGPSMLLTSSAESLAFVLGALTPMPAVKIFSLYASLAVWIDFILQITCFVSLMTLDCKRELSKRYNLLCCVRSCSATRTGIFKEINDLDADENFHANVQISSDENNAKLADMSTDCLSDDEDEHSDGILFRVFKDYYAPFIVNKRVRPVVVILFLAFFFASLCLLPRVRTGLDQKLSMPRDSYVLDYFESLEKYLSVGVPVYFVVKGQTYSSVENQNLICASTGCNSDSFLNQIKQATLLPNYTKIAAPASSWIDDYFDWLSGECCRVSAHDLKKFCPSSLDTTNCVSCPIRYINDTNRPVPEDFKKYLKFFLVDNPGPKCPKAGHAAYGEAIELINKDNDFEVGATFFMSYHSVGITSKDFIESLKHANRISSNITKMLRNNAKKHTNDSKIIENIQVFPYSIFYVFYEQYLTIWEDAARNLCVSLLAVFFVTIILMGLDFYTALIVCTTIAMIIINMFGAMCLLNIELNAISLVNLVMVVGISVEFCAHTAREFAISISGDRIERAKYAITHMGSSVFSGITLTKILGIIVLAFSHSQLFQVFYFKMYLSVVIIGASHGLVLLPVLLSYLGPGLNKIRCYNHYNLSNQRLEFKS